MPVTNVEHKMGLKVSATCELAFGQCVLAKGWLVGEAHNGIAHVRGHIGLHDGVGTKANATLSGYLNALQYAGSCVQGCLT